MAVLRTDKVDKHFGGLAALNGLSIELQEGEILGIIGPNGAGKSTLVNVLAGVTYPTRGRIFLGDRDITASPAHRRFQMGIGRTFQLTRPLVNLTLIQNVMVGPLFGKGVTQGQARRKAEEVCRQMGLSRLHRTIDRLTALEVKKMEIARALANSPSIIFLDEVMAGLNKDEVMEMVDLVRQIHTGGVAIGIIEHVMRVIRELTDRVVVLDWGEVLAEGPYEEISRDPRVVSAYLGKDDNA